MLISLLLLLHRLHRLEDAEFCHEDQNLFSHITGEPHSSANIPFFPVNLLQYSLRVIMCTNLISMLLLAILSETMFV